MIIGNNTPRPNMQNNKLNSNNNFQTKLNRLKQNAGFNTSNQSNIYTHQHSDPTSKKEMNDKAFSMLQERLNNGLITLEEFNRKCNQLRKKN